MVLNYRAGGLMSTLLHERERERELEILVNAGERKPTCPRDARAYSCDS